MDEAFEDFQGDAYAWFYQTLKESYEYATEIPVEIQNWTPTTQQGTFDLPDQSRVLVYTCAPSVGEGRSVVVTVPELTMGRFQRIGAGGVFLPSGAYIPDTGEDYIYAKGSFGLQKVGQSDPLAYGKFHVQAKGGFSTQAVKWVDAVRGIVLETLEDTPLLKKDWRVKKASHQKKRR